MTTYYVDPSSASEASPYDTWTKAAHSLATVLAIPPAAGDIIYCRKSGGGSGETTSGTMAVSSSGTNAAGFIKIIGCNASGNVDGTRYTLDGNSGGFDIFNLAGYDLWWLENIEVKNTGGSSKNGFYSSSNVSQGIFFLNCCANNCSGYGFNCSYNIGASLIVRCVSYSNTLSGFRIGGNFNKILFSCGRDNSEHGVVSDGNIGALIYGSVFHGNTANGIGTVYFFDFILNCVIDGNGSNGVVFGATGSADFASIIGSRITNHSGAGDIGLNANSKPTVTGWNYFENNQGDNIQNATLHYPIPLEGGTTSSNSEDPASVTDYGYVDSANHDFSTRYDADDPLRRKAITIPWT